MKIIAAIYKVVDTIAYWFVVAAYAVLVSVLAVQVFSRFVFSLPFMWAEEFSRYLFIWIVYIGTGIAFSRGGHLVVDIFSAKFPIKLRLVLEVIFNIIIIVFAVVVAYYGFQYSALNASKPFYSTKAINLGVAYLAVPIGLCLAILNVIRNLYEIFTKKEAYFDNRGAY